MPAISVAVVNDYEVVVRGLCAMLRSYEDRVSIRELDTNADVAAPVDIALYDTYAAPQADRDDVRLLAANPLVGKTVVFSWNCAGGLVDSALANGAHGYVSKTLPAGRLVEALESIHAGRQSVHTGTIGTKIIPGDWPGREEGITQRESEVLALITQGLSNAEVAEQANLSINSVKTYIRSCYRRIGAASRSQAVLWGVEHGFRPDRVRVRPYVRD